MVGVFVAFIRVVYGRMIYMSLPISSALFRCLQSSQKTPVSSMARVRRENILLQRLT